MFNRGYVFMVLFEDDIIKFPPLSICFDFWRNKIDQNHTITYDFPDAFKLCLYPASPLDLSYTPIAPSPW